MESWTPYRSHERGDGAHGFGIEHGEGGNGSDREETLPAAQRTRRVVLNVDDIGGTEEAVLVSDEGEQPGYAECEWEAGDDAQSTQTPSPSTPAQQPPPSSSREWDYAGDYGVDSREGDLDAAASRSVVVPGAQPQQPPGPPGEEAWLRGQESAASNVPHGHPLDSLLHAGVAGEVAPAVPTANSPGQHVAALASDSSDEDFAGPAPWNPHGAAAAGATPGTPPSPRPTEAGHSSPAVRVPRRQSWLRTHSSRGRPGRRRTAASRGPAPSWPLASRSAAATPTAPDSPPASAGHATEGSAREEAAGDTSAGSGLLRAASRRRRRAARSARRAACPGAWCSAVRPQFFCETGRHATPVRAVAAAADGRSALSAASDGSVFLWTLQSQPARTTARAVAQAAGGEGGSTGSGAAGDSSNSESSGERARPWAGEEAGVGADSEGTRLQFARRLPGHSRPATAAALTPTGAIAATADMGGCVRLWFPAESLPLLALTAPAAVLGLALSSAADRLALALENGDVMVWRLPARLHTLVDAARPGPRPQATPGDGTGDGKAGEDRAPAQASASAAAAARRFELAAADAQKEQWLPEFAPVHGHGPSEPVLQHHLSRVHGGGATCCALGVEDSLLLTGGADGVLRLWRVGSASLVRATPAHAPGAEGGGGVAAVAWSPSRRVYASGGGDGLVRMWEAGTGRCLRRWEMQAQPRCPPAQAPWADPSWAEAGAARRRITALAFDGRDPTLVAAGAAGGVWCLWDTSSGEALHCSVAHASDVAALAFVRAPRLLLLSGGVDRRCAWVLLPWG